MATPQFKPNQQNNETQLAPSLMKSLVLSPLLTFSEAAKRWLETRKPFLGPATLASYTYYIGNLNRFFGERPLVSISGDLIREYQIMRKQTLYRGRPLSSSLINHETNTLSQVLNRAVVPTQYGKTTLWREVSEGFQSLPDDECRKLKVMTLEQERALFRAAQSNPAWAIAYCAALLTVNTTASGVELRKLKLRHVHLDANPPFFEIPPEAAKCNSRVRVIPMNAVAQQVMKWLTSRAKELGAHAPDHYLFPFRLAPNTYDVTRPASKFFIRSSFEGMRAAADLNWVTPHALRHQAITKLLEAGNSDQTVMAIAGHVSKKMLAHYSHIRIAAKLGAVNALVNQQLGVSLPSGGASLEEIAEQRKKPPLPEIP